MTTGSVSIHHPDPELRVFGDPAFKDHVEKWKDHYYGLFARLIFKCRNPKKIEVSGIIHDQTFLIKNGTADGQSICTSILREVAPTYDFSVIMRYLDSDHNSLNKEWTPPKTAS